MSPSKHWKLSNNSMGDEWTIYTLKVMFQSSKKMLIVQVSKKDLTGILFEVENFICSIFHNQINLGNNIFHNLLDYGNEYIKKLSADKNKARNSLLLIDSSINEKINLRDEFDVSDDRKELHSPKNIRRNDQTSITNMTNVILNSNYRIDELNKKRVVFSNDVSKIKRYKFKLKEILKGWEKIQEPNRVWFR